MNDTITNDKYQHRLPLPTGGELHLRMLPAPNPRGDVLYVHGATFSSDLSIFYPFDGRSWANALADAGFNVWGFDFAGYGSSSRYDVNSPSPRGRASEALPQLRAVVNHIRQHSGVNTLNLLAHSWGSVVAAQYASESTKNRAENIKALILFGPPVVRDAKTKTDTTRALPSHHPLTALAQYRRFVEDVPRGEAQVLSEVHFAAWGDAWLATDTSAGERTPASVMTPYGPVADLAAMWSGESIYDAAKITMPVLLARGEWDSVCNDIDAKHLMSALGTADKTDIKIQRATHLMHLESQRGILYDTVNTFLDRTSKVN